MLESQHLPGHEQSVAEGNEWEQLRWEVSQIIQGSRHFSGDWVDQMKQGAQALASISKNADYSLIPLMISAGMEYYKLILRQWAVYRKHFKSIVWEFVNLIHSRITDIESAEEPNHSLSFLSEEFRPFRELFEKSTKLKVGGKAPQLRRNEGYDEPSCPHSSGIGQTADSESCLTQPTGKGSPQLESGKKEVERQSEDISERITQQKEGLVQYRKDSVFYGTKGGAETSITHEKRSEGRDKSERDVVIRPYKDITGTVVPILKEYYYKIKLHFNPPTSKDKENNYKIEELPGNKGSCLGCTSYFYQNQDLSMPVPDQPVCYFQNLDYLFNSDRFKDAFLRQMVSYLNAEGGVILMGCEETDKGVIPAEEVTLEAYKDSWENKLNGILKEIHPEVNINNHFEIGYVPVCQSPPSSHLQWLKGTYVLRVIVHPVEPSQTYFYTRDARPFFSTFRRKGPDTSNKQEEERQGRDDIVDLKEQAIYAFMKYRYNKYPPKQMRTDLILRKVGNYTPAVIRHLGVCEFPLKGMPEYGDHPNRPKVPEISGVENRLKAGREDYKNIALLICRSNLIEKIESHLENVDKVTTKIEVAFPEFKFGLSSNTFLCWHSVKFDKLSSYVKKEKRFMELNDRKPILLISTVNTVRVMDRPLTANEKIEVEAVMMEQARDKPIFKIFKDYMYIQCKENINAAFLYYFIKDKFQKRVVFERMPERDQDVKEKHNAGRARNKEPLRQQPQRSQEVAEAYSEVETEATMMVPVINQSMVPCHQWQDEYGYYNFQYANGYIWRRDYYGNVNMYYNANLQQVDIYGRILEQ